MNILLAAMAVGAVHANPGIDEYVQKTLSDAYFVAHLVRGDQTELKKINEGFGNAYRFDKTTIRYKDPFMLRLDATVEDTTISYILNGPFQLIRVPKIHVSTKTDLTKSPGKRQTALDFGILVPSLFENLFKAEFVRIDRATGDPVFDVTYQDRARDTSRNRIWVDPTRHIVAKREWFNQSGRQLATFIYDDPKQEGGVWLPTRLTVKNMDDAVAGVTKYDSIRVNAGISDDVFSLGK